MVQRQISQNVTFSMRGTWPKRDFLLINWKRTKGEISDGNGVKTPYNTATIFIKCNVFLCEAHRPFLVVFRKKNWIKVEILLINWKRTKGEILDENWAKTPYNTPTIFTKCNVFYARHIVFILLFFIKK